MRPFFMPGEKMADLAKLVVSLEAQTAKYQNELDRANRKLDRFAKNTENSVRKVATVFNTVLAAAAGSSMALLVKNTLNAANRLGDLSTRLGTSVEGLSRLEYAADLTGVSARTLETGLQRMTRRIAEAANGSGEAVGALNELGLSASKLNSLRPDQQFEVLADALETVPGKADKVRLAMKLLDSEGVALLQTMAGGSEEIRRLGAESDRMGRTIGSDFAASATAANAAIKKLEASGAGLANQLAISVGPSVAAVADWLANNLPDAAKFASDSINLLAAGALKAFSKIIEFIRVPIYYMGKLSDEAAEADKKLYEMQQNMSGAADVIFESMSESANKMDEFQVKTGEAVVKLADFKGETKSTTQATKELNDALREQNKIRDAIANSGRQRLDEVEEIRQSLLSREEAEQEAFDRRKSILDAARRDELISETKHMDMVADLRVQHNERLAQIELEKNNAIAASQSLLLGATSDLFGSMADLTKTFGGEQSTAYKALFAVSKGFAIANAIVQIQTAIANASAAGPFPANLGAMASVASATAGLISTITSTQFAGAYDKGGYIPSGQVGLVGEIGPELVRGPAQVTSRADTAAMMGGGQQNIKIINSVDPSLMLEALGSAAGEKVIMNTVKRNQAALRGR